MGETTRILSLEYAVLMCWCGLPVLCSDSLAHEFRQEGKVLYCVLGHEFVIRKTENARLRAELEQERRARIEAQGEEARAKERAAQAEEAAMAAEKRRARMEKRIRRGVCPYCKRTFADLARHMECKHEKGARP